MIIKTTLQEQQRINDSIRTAARRAGGIRDGITIPAGSLTAGGTPLRNMTHVIDADLVGVGRVTVMRVLVPALRWGHTPQASVHLRLRPQAADDMLRVCLVAGAVPTDRPPMCLGDWPDVDALMAAIEAYDTTGSVA